MSLMINANIDDLYQIICSKKFIYKIYLLEDKSHIKKINEHTYIFKRKYNHKDINQIKDIVSVPEHIINLINTNLSAFDIGMETKQEVIQKKDDSFIIKYTSVMKEPDYIYKLLGNTKIILYVQFNINKKDKNLTVVHFNKKFLNAYEDEDDSNIINTSDNDIITHVEQQNNKLHIDENIIKITETFLGHHFVHNIIIPTINNIYDLSFMVLQDIYIKRLTKYMLKNNIEVYKKKF